MSLVESSNMVYYTPLYENEQFEGENKSMEATWFLITKLLSHVEILELRKAVHERGS